MSCRSVSGATWSPYIHMAWRVVAVAMSLIAFTACSMVLATTPVRPLSSADIYCVYLFHFISYRSSFQSWHDVKGPLLFFVVFLLFFLQFMPTSEAHSSTTEKHCKNDNRDSIIVGGIKETRSYDSECKGYLNINHFYSFFFTLGERGW